MMTVNIFYSSEFRKEVKRLAKKYRSIPKDLIELWWSKSYHI